MLVLLNVYTQEGFVYRILNEATRVADETKLKSMGPCAAALLVIILKASQYRKDINPADFAKCKYFNGTSMTEAQLNQIRQLAKDYKSMCLYGFTSLLRGRRSL